MTVRLDGRVALVTGASRGVGKGISVGLSNSESPRFIGRAVAHLADDPAVAKRSGSALVAAELAREYGFTDVDGRSPTPLTLDTV